MKEIKDIIAAYDKAVGDGKKTALATVVYVEGSSYRRPGARMLATDAGRITGAISGGCLERDVLRKAQLAIAQNRSRMVKYDSRDDEDNMDGTGLGCNGVIHILIEPIDENDEQNPISILQQCLRKRQPGIILTLFSLFGRNVNLPGTCFVKPEDGNGYGVIPVGLEEDILADIHTGLRVKRSFAKTYFEDDQQPNTTALIEYVKPQVSLVIIGAGNDVIPMVNMAKMTGWDVTVIDGRANYITKQRFPLADRLILSKSQNALDSVNIDRLAAFVLMTHNYNYDLDILRQLAGESVGYIGVLGPAKKMCRMINEIEVTGKILSPRQKEVIYGPAGLDIGAETAEEIAISILSEIQAVMAVADGKTLREKKGPIHNHVPLVEEMRLLRTA